MGKIENGVITHIGIVHKELDNIINDDDEMREVIQDEEEEARRGVTQEDDDMEPQVLMEGMEGVDGDWVFEKEREPLVLLYFRGLSKETLKDEKRNAKGINKRQQVIN